MVQRRRIRLGLQVPRPLRERVESDFLHRLSQSFLVQAGSGSAVIGSFWGYGEPSLFTALAWPAAARWVVQQQD